MLRTRIEWVNNPDGSQGYTINPVKGLCPVACSYCYARRLYKRFKWNPEIRYDIAHHLPLDKLTKPSRIFMGSTMELFGDWVKPEWMLDMMSTPKSYPQHTFIFLTKQPQNLIKWSPFAENCWIGVTATNPEQIRLAFKHLHYDIKASVKFISFEPLQGMIFSSDNVIERYIKASGVNWVIIGAQTPYSKKTFPKWEWVKEIIEACDKANIPVFLKENLGLPKYSCEGGMPFYKRHPNAGTMELRQELPI